MTVRKINFYLASFGAETDQQRLFAQANKLTLLQQTFVEIAPPQLAKYCTVGWLSEGNLTLYASNGAIAAKLKQISPSLILKLNEKSYEVTAIRVVVQANNYTTGMGNKAGKNREIGPPRMGSAGMESLGQLAAGLPASPLKSAVESLLKKQAKQRET